MDKCEKHRWHIFEDKRITDYFLRPDMFLGGKDNYVSFVCDKCGSTKRVKLKGEIKDEKN